jgi:membrane associated rhomboid family serine protease
LPASGRWAFVPAYLFGLGGFDGPINRSAGLLGLFSYVFVHEGAAHLFANAAALALFGPAAERRLGRLGLTMLFFAAAVFAALAEGALTEDRLTPLVGASGGICGLMGAAATLTPRAQLRFRLWPTWREASFPLIWLLFFDLAGNLALGTLALSEFAPLSESVAWRAHLAGAAFGAAAGVIIGRRRIDDAKAGDDGDIRVTHPFSRRAGLAVNALTLVAWAAAVAAATRGCF